MCVCVCVCVCVSKHFRAQRPNGWSDRHGGGTDGRVETPERHWCRLRVGRRHVARGTCRRVKVYQKFFEQPYRSHGGHHRSETPRSHAYCTNLKSIGGAVPVGCQLHAPRGEEAVLTWGPPMKVNFELATPNSVHGCTLASPTWRRMKKGTGVHCARAVHVQVVCTLKNSHAPTGQNGEAPLIPKLAGHMHTVRT